MLVGARWLHFASLFALFGGSAFWLAAGRGLALPRSLATTRRWMRLAAPIAAASGIAWLLATMAGMAGGLAAALDPGFIELFVLATPFGPVEVLRLALLAALIAVPLLPRARQPAAWASIAGALLVSQAWLGHAAEGGRTALGWAMVASYAVHILAGALWLGGLPVLLPALREDAAQGLAALRRFSALATAAAIATVASGTANTLFHLGHDAGSDVHLLAATEWGQVLGLKLGCVAAVLLLAAATRYRLLPRLSRGERADARGAIASEAAAGLMVLLAAAVLGITAPPR